MKYRSIKRMNPDWAYVINLDEYADIGSYWIALYALDNDITYFDSFEVEHVSKEIVRDKNIKINILRIQANNSITCGYFCIGFTDFILEGKALIDYTYLFSPYDFEKMTISL